MRRLLPLLLGLAAAAARADDPAGTVVVELEENQAQPISGPVGSNVICDDLSVVMPEFALEGFLLRGLKPGSTLCGVWLGNQKPGGLYRVNVHAKPPPPPPPPDAGPPDAGPIDDGGLPDADPD
jgi:hypothetical protein